MFTRMWLIVLIVILSSTVLAQDTPPPPPLGRLPLVECVESENVPCVEVVDDISDIVGTWRRYLEGGTAMGFMVYAEDGSFETKTDLQAEPDLTGIIDFQDGLGMMSITEGAETPADCVAPGSYEMRLIRIGAEPVALTYRQVRADNCVIRTQDLGEPMLYYTGTGEELPELEAEVPVLAQPLIPCPTEMEEGAEAYPCDLIAMQPKDVAGIWKVYVDAAPNIVSETGMGFHRFNADGSYFIADTVENSSAAYTNYPFGSFSFDGPLMTITADGPVPPPCQSGDHYLRIIRFGDQPVALSYTPVEDTCGPRLGNIGEALIWISNE